MQQSCDGEIDSQSPPDKVRADGVNSIAAPPAVTVTTCSIGWVFYADCRGHLQKGQEGLAWILGASSKREPWMIRSLDEPARAPESNKVP